MFIARALCISSRPPDTVSNMGANKLGGPNLDLRHSFGERVRQLRTQQGLSLEQLAERSGMHWTHIQRIEQAKINPKLDTVGSLAAGLGVSVSSLFGAQASSGDLTLDTLLDLLKGRSETEIRLVADVAKCILRNLPLGRDC